MIHVWYIYLHLGHLWGFYVGKYTIHGSSGDSTALGNRMLHDPRHQQITTESTTKKRIENRHRRAMMRSKANGNQWTMENHPFLLWQINCRWFFFQSKLLVYQRIPWNLLGCKCCVWICGLKYICSIVSSIIHHGHARPVGTLSLILQFHGIEMLDNFFCMILSWEVDPAHSTSGVAGGKSTCITRYISITQKSGFAGCHKKRFSH